jgi:diguanylate cyclase (GGDEF)-like protein
MGAQSMPDTTLDHEPASHAAVVCRQDIWSTTVDPVVDALPAQIAVLDAEGWIRACNRAWRARAAAGRLGDPVDGRWNYFDVCRKAARAGCTESARVLDGLTELLAGERAEFVMTYHCPLGARHDWYQLTATATELAGQRCAVVMHTDVTSLQRDALTGLANRAVFEARLQHSLAGARRSGRPTGLLVLDLDGFKPVNDQLGHLAGDVLLRDVAGRLQDVTQGEHLVARLGGDEFAVVPAAPVSRGALTELAQSLCAVLAEPFEITGSAPFEIGASIGIALYPDHGSDVASLIEAADRALYAAKRAGRNRVAVAGATAAYRVADTRTIALRGLAS